jgi:SAM-dependent methyltransferase
MRSRVGRRIWWQTHGIDQETDFWAVWLRSGGGTRWAEDYARRLEPAPTIDDALITDWLDASDLDEIRILDVGAGPISRVGNTYPHKSIALVAVDPLADEYRRLLSEARVDPYVRTSAAHGERLLDTFAPETFDIVYAVNSVDHSYDPVRIIRNMVALVRPDGVALLRHVRNEGEHRRYSGLHQWNLEPSEDGDLIVWNAVVRASMREVLGDEAIVEAWEEDGQTLARVTRRSHSSVAGPFTSSSR